jgi:hypothetical protein
MLQKLAKWQTCLWAQAFLAPTLKRSWLNHLHSKIYSSFKRSGMTFDIYLLASIFCYFVGTIWKLSKENSCWCGVFLLGFFSLDFRFKSMHYFFVWCEPSVFVRNCGDQSFELDITTIDDKILPTYILLVYYSDVVWVIYIYTMYKEGTWV